MIEILIMLPGIHMEYRMEVFSLSFGMTNPNPSTFLSNVQWKLVKQPKTVISIVFFITKLSLPTCLKY